MTMLPPDAQRPWRDWYSLGIWRRRRALHLRGEPLCRMCLERNVVTPATIADHIESHGGDWNKFRLGALQSLCKDCHDRRKKLLDIDGHTHDIDVDGWPTDPRHPANARRPP